MHILITCFFSLLFWRLKSLCGYSYFFPFLFFETNSSFNFHEAYFFLRSTGSQKKKISPCLLLLFHNSSLFCFINYFSLTHPFYSCLLLSLLFELLCPLHLLPKILLSSFFFFLPHSFTYIFCLKISYFFFQYLHYCSPYLILSFFI